MSKVWFITGAGRGFGRQFATAALERGDKVAATARNTAALDDLVARYGDLILPIQLDVRDRDHDFAAVRRAADHFGRLDVVINNAGYGLFGAVEELSEEQLRDQMETNFFGLFHITQAVLPIMRAQGSGHIIQISSVGGIAAFTGQGGYHASKFAVEGLTETLAQEVTPFGIHVTLVEPGGYPTDWAGSSGVHADENPAYSDFHAQIAERSKNTPPEAMSVVEATGPAMLKLVDAENPPLRAFFGTICLTVAEHTYQQRLDSWRKWQPLAEQANGH